MIVEIKREKVNPKAAGAGYGFARWFMNDPSDLDVFKEVALNEIKADVLEYLILNEKHEEAEDTVHAFKMMQEDILKGIQSYTMQFSTGDYHITITLEGEK